MPLSNTLAFYLKNDESGTGTRADATPNGRNFTNNNSATNGTGKLNNGTTFVRSSSQFLSRASEATLQLTSSWHAAFWIKFTTLDNYMVFFAKGSGGAEAWAYTQANGGGDFQIANGSLGSMGFPAGTFTTGVWYLVILWWDSGANQMGYSINNATPVTASTSGTPTGGSADMTIGAGNSQHYCDAIIDEFAFGKWVPTSDDRTLYYSGGTPPGYDTLAGAATYTATAALTTAPATTAVSATSDPPTFSASAALATSPATLSASGASAPPTFSGSAALVAGPATSSSAATATPPTFTASAALSAAAATLAASATYGTASAVFPSGGLSAREGYALRAREGYALTAREGYALRAREG